MCRNIFYNVFSARGRHAAKTLLLSRAAKLMWIVEFGSILVPNPMTIVTHILFVRAPTQMKWRKTCFVVAFMQHLAVAWPLAVKIRCDDGMTILLFRTINNLQVAFSIASFTGAAGTRSFLYQVIIMAHTGFIGKFWGAVDHFIVCITRGSFLSLYNFHQWPYEHLQ